MNSEGQISKRASLAAPAEAEAEALRVRHLSHRYGPVWALKNVSFELGRGEILGLMGTRGAGKSTALRAIASLLQPVDGEIEVLGVNARTHPARVRRLIGYMPDRAGVYPHLTAREYLHFFARCFGNDNPEVVDAVLELVHLTDVKHQLLQELNHRGRQILQLARTLLHDPELLILDEPATKLDHTTRVQLRDILLELSELGKTVILSSEGITELSDACGWVAIIEAGQLLEFGRRQEVSQRLSVAPAPGASGVPPSTGSPAPTRDELECPPLPPWVQDAGAPEATPAPPLQAANPVHAVTSGPSVPEQTPGGATIPASTVRTLRLKVLPGQPKLATLLAASDAIRKVTETGPQELQIAYTGDEHFVADLVSYLTGHGIRLVAIEPQPEPLDTVLNRLTEPPNHD